MDKKAKLEFTIAECKVLDEEVVDEKTGDKILRVQAKWQQAGDINNNKRRYRRELLQREINRLQPQIEKGAVYGATYHPRTGEAEIDDVSHVWEKVWMDKDGACYGEAKILPTQRGKNAQILIKHGGRIGLSSRGFGTTTQKTETIGGKTVSFNDVNDDYQLASPGDFVLTPSVLNAQITKVLERQMGEVS